MQRREVEVETGRRRVTEVTAHCARFAAEQGVDGLLHVFLPHATAAPVTGPITCCRH